MSYYVSTLNAGDVERSAYKRVSNAKDLSKSIRENFDLSTKTGLVVNVANYENTGHLDTDTQLVLMNNFGKVRDRPMKYIYTLMAWANDLDIPMTKKSLRGAYKKTFGSQLDYRYVRIVSNFWKLKFFKGTLGIIVPPKATSVDTTLGEEIPPKGSATTEGANKVVSILNENFGGTQWKVEENSEESSEESTESTEESKLNLVMVDEEGDLHIKPVEIDLTNVCREEASIEPTKDLEKILISQKEEIECFIDFVSSRNLMYEYLEFARRVRDTE